MGGAFMEEQANSRAQYLDLVYSQSRTLYDLIPHFPHPSADPTKPPAKNPMDGVVGSIQPPSTMKPAKQQSPSTAPTFFVEVNSIQSLQTPSIKKKGKGKTKKIWKPLGESQDRDLEE